MSEKSESNLGKLAVVIREDRFGLVGHIIQEWPAKQFSETDEGGFELEFNPEKEPLGTMKFLPSQVRIL